MDKLPLELFYHLFEHSLFSHLLPLPSQSNERDPEPPPQWYIATDRRQQPGGDDDSFSRASEALQQLVEKWFYGRVEFVYISSGTGDRDAGK
jgi:hypothetical protein